MMTQDAVKTAFVTIKELERIDDALVMISGLSNGVEGHVYSSVKKINLNDILNLNEVVRKGLYEKRAELTCRLAELGVEAE